MSKHLALGVTVAVALVAVLAIGVYATTWDMNYDQPQDITYDPDTSSGNLDHNTLNYVIFEHYGPLLIVLAVLMFGAMVGGICIAREEVERDEESQEVKE